MQLKLVELWCAFAVVIVLQVVDYGLLLIVLFGNLIIVEMAKIVILVVVGAFARGPNVLVALYHVVSLVLGDQVLGRLVLH